MKSKKPRIRSIILFLVHVASKIYLNSGEIIENPWWYNNMLVNNRPMRPYIILYKT